MLKKIIEIVSWILIIAFLTVTLGFVGERRKQVVCRFIDVSISDQSQNQFVNRYDILDLLKNKGIKPLNSKLCDINLASIEYAIMAHPAVRKVNAWTTIDGVLHIGIWQRNPLIRIMRKNFESFYIDTQGKLMPLSDKFTARVMLANGNISESFARYYKPVVPDDPAGVVGCGIIQGIVYLAWYISRDPFWKSQIQQIYVNERNEYELVPLVGKQIIIFGNLENYKKKFSHLKAVYEQGFSRTGWNNYSIINLKYENQVVCTRNDIKLSTDTVKTTTTPVAQNKTKKPVK